MAHGTDKLLESLEAMDRLNSYVRSPSCRSVYYTGWHDFVYAAKRYAIRDAHLHRLATHRRVHKWVKCNRCGGSGEYRSVYGYGPVKKCWTCSGAKHVMLEFIETTIQVSGRVLVWHSPLSSFHAVLPLSLAEAPSVDAGDWTPNQPGRDLATTELIRDVLTVESSWRQGIMYVNGADVFRRLPAIAIGATPDDVCSLCGDRALTESYGVTRWPIRWSDHACLKCAKQYREHWHTKKSSGPAWCPSIFEAFRVPETLIAPDVRHYMETRQPLTEEAVQHA